MYITCCRDCEDRHEKCHAHCETYLTNKILKILVEAQEEKKRRTAHGIINQKQIRVSKVMHDNHLRRRK
jgi:hypothetical protein